jgi:hypothetical protein
MKRSYQIGTLAMLFGAGLFTVAGCRPREEVPAVEQPGDADATVSLMSIDLGKVLQPDNKVVDETDDFAPSDTVYASITTSGTMPNAALTTRWLSADGQVLDEVTQNVSLSGTMTTAFHSARSSTWPVGNYKVEVLANGTRIGEENFEIKAGEKKASDRK